MRIFGGDTHSRDFVYISDVVDANILAARNGAVNGGVFNVGTGVD
jgi:nucleoside-diphosphate-sugar epimerase